MINYIHHFCQTNHWTLFTFLILISFACQSQVNRLDISDPRLPSEAKQRIADAEDALIIAEAERRTAELQLLKAQTEQSRLNEAPSALVQQRSFELMLQERVALKQAIFNYTKISHRLSKIRLKLIYAQTAMRYDLAVYDLEPLESVFKEAQSDLLKQRKAMKLSRSQWEKSLKDWWTSFKTNASSLSAEYWRFEFDR